jgi:hypothetical protein
MTRLLFIDLISAGLKLIWPILVSPWMIFVVLANLTMALEAKWNRVVDILSTFFSSRYDMSNFNISSTSFPAETTMAIAPEEALHFIFFTKIT